METLDESQHNLLALTLRSASRRIETPHVGTGAGSSSSNPPWNDNDKDIIWAYSTEL